MAEPNISHTTCNPSVAVTAKASSWFICIQIHGQTKSKNVDLSAHPHPHTPTHTHTPTLSGTYSMQFFFGWYNKMRPKFSCTLAGMLTK